MKKAIVILSGGLDSTTLLYHVKKLKYKTFAISFFYGQRHKKELVMASKTCEKLGIEHRIINLSCIAPLIDGSALTGKIKVPYGHYASKNMKKTVVPNRNMIMASIAIGWAVNIGADMIALGVHAGDHAIYPDCRGEFISKLHALAQVANYKPVFVYAPFLKLIKGAIVKQGLELGVDYSLTWTCYEGGKRPCGKCGSCVERAEAFSKNKTIDPLC